MKNDNDIIETINLFSAMTSLMMDIIPDINEEEIRKTLPMDLANLLNGNERTIDEYIALFEDCDELDDEPSYRLARLDILARLYKLKLKKVGYRYPTKGEAKIAFEEWEWPKTEAERGFTIFDYDGIGLLCVEVITDCYWKDMPTDVEASIEAERIGLCKIIPVSELPANLAEDYKFFGWVDTPDNRKRIKDFADKY